MTTQEFNRACQSWVDACTDANAEPRRACDVQDVDGFLDFLSMEWPTDAARHRGRYESFIRWWQANKPDGDGE